jgi:hypothetical protein
LAVDGIIGPDTWSAMQPLLGTGPAPTPPIPSAPVKPTTIIELTDFVRSVSMGLTGDSNAKLALPGAPGSTLGASLSFPQGWSGTLIVDGNGAVASRIQFPIAMTHGGTSHVMPVTVFSTLIWSKLSLNDPGVTAGADAIMPLSNRFILAFTQGTGPTRIAAGIVDIFPLETDIQTYATVVFGYSVDGQTGAVDPLDLSGAPSGQLRQWLANHGLNGPISTSKTAIVAVYDLTLCGPRDDYQPKSGAPMGAANVVRTYPLLSVWSSRPLTSVTAVLDIARPATTLMEGMARGGAITASLYSDMNSSVRSLWDDMNAAVKAAILTAASLPIAVLNPLPVPLLIAVFSNIPSTRWDSLFAHYSLDATQSNIVVVSPRLGRRRNTTARQIWDNSKSVYSPSPAPVDKVARQGMFDNVHVAPSMDYQGAAASMAPLCQHDCLHMHWRWGAVFSDKPMFGWDGGKPYQRAGAPMIPENQTLSVSVSGNTMSYTPSAENAPAQAWQIFMHHGTGYVSSLTLAGMAAPLLEAAQLTALPSFAAFYYHNRMWETGGSSRAADTPRLNESTFGPLETM